MSRALRTTICVSTSQPTLSLTPGGGGGSITLLDPHTGSVLSSARICSDLSGKVPLGVSKLSLFSANDFKDENNNTLAVAYGSSPSTVSVVNAKKDVDAYGMLFTIRSVASSSFPPILHWKCRLPEPNMSAAGLSVSPCGNYVVGGGQSGTLYVWKTIGGTLLRTVKAHYRAVTVLTWSNTGVVPHLVTGGADGMVHVYSLLDLVESMHDSNKKGNSMAAVQPIRSWSKHHLSINDITLLSGDRMASAAEDGLVIIVEIFSGATIATIQMPASIRAFTQTNNRIFCASQNGSIYILDLDSFAMHQTIQHGATVIVQKQQQANKNNDNIIVLNDASAVNHRDTVFGYNSQNQQSKDNNDDSSNNPTPYQVELRGHDRALTSIAVFEGENDPTATASTMSTPEWLVSGDEAGIVRVWDLQSRCCVRVLRPWSHTAVDESSSAGDGGKNKKNKITILHPVTSIRVLQTDAEALVVDVDGTTNTNNTTSSTLFNTTTGSKKNVNNITSLITPFQKFEVQHDQFSDPYSNQTKILLPFLQPKRDAESMSFWDVSKTTFSFQAAMQKRRRVLYTNQNQKEESQKEESTNQNQLNTVQQEEIDKLRKELEEAKNTIKRWETVNNKLMERLQK